eukprot:3082089-Pleurochrysis_carterae.AAC.1
MGFRVVGGSLARVSSEGKGREGGRYVCGGEGHVLALSSRTSSSRRFAAHSAAAWSAQSKRRA